MLVQLDPSSRTTFLGWSMASVRTVPSHMKTMNSCNFSSFFNTRNLVKDFRHDVTNYLSIDKIFSVCHVLEHILLMQ